MRLDEFLSESQREGKLDSEGAFDISRQKALQKVASLGLPFPYAWALKLVQSAVEAKARKFEIRLTTDRIEVEFPSKTEWETPELGVRKKAVMLSLLDNLKSYRFRSSEFFGGELLEQNVTKQVKAQAEQWNSEFGLKFDFSIFREPETKGWAI